MNNDTINISRAEYESLSKNIAINVNQISLSINDYLLKSEFKNEISFIYLFGSALFKENNNDIDLIVYFTENNKIGLLKFAQLQKDLSFALGKKVDLVTNKGISKYIKKEVLSVAKKIYEKK